MALNSNQNAMNTLQDTRAVKILQKLIDDTQQNGIITNTVIQNLKELRPHTITEKLPLLAKATRLAAEHIDEYGTFSIDIPQDEAIEDEDGTVIEPEPIESDPNASFLYFLQLIKNVDRKDNEAELRVYVKNLKDF